MVDLASLVVRLVADTARYQSELERARQDLSSFERIAKGAVGKIAIAAGAAVLGAATAFAAMAKSAIDAAADMNDLAKSTGISTEALSQLQYAAEQSGTDLDGLVTGLQKFTRQATEAASKGGAARDAFSLISVSVEDAAGKLKPTEQLLLDVAEQFSRYSDGAAKAAFAQELFGKSGAALIPFLNEGRGGIERLMQEADKLGITLSAKTAKAANDFNSQLTQMNTQVRGIVLQITADMLPMMLQLTSAFADYAKESNHVRGFVDGLSTAFRAVLYVGIAVADTFGDLGRLIAALYAAQAAVLKGQFAQAIEIIKLANADGIAAEARTSKLLAAIWDDRAAKHNAALGTYESSPVGRRIAEGIAKPKDFPVPVPATVVDPLQEVVITLKRIETTEVDAYFQNLERQTRTRTGQVLAAYAEQKHEFKLLLDEGYIDQVEHDARLRELQTKLLNDFSQAAPAAAKEVAKEINEYELQAARNTQDIIANTFQSLATGADVSARSILRSFGAMIIQLAAQAAAANLAGKLFGEAGGAAKGSGSGWVGLAMSALGAASKRDKGGRGRAGMAYAIGTGAQPEMFIPDRSGTFVPAGAGGMAVTNNFSIRGDAPVSRRTQLQIAAAASLGVARASRRNN